MCGGGSFGKILGAVAGGLIGGPVGAVAGFGAGEALIDKPQRAAKKAQKQSLAQVDTSIKDVEKKQKLKAKQRKPVDIVLTSGQGVVDQGKLGS